MGKLKFKGDKKEKKHKKRKVGDESDEINNNNQDQQSEGWLNPPNQIHISGPIFLISITPSQSDTTADSTQFNPSAIAIFPTPVSNIAPVKPALLSTEALQTLEPDDVNHVWVCTRVLDSDSKVTLRASNGRYLASDQLGSVSAQSEARGPQEEWEFEPISSTSSSSNGQSSSNNPPDERDGIFRLKSVIYGKYLSVEEVAGGKFEIRCDTTLKRSKKSSKTEGPSNEDAEEEEDDPSCHFLVRMQAAELIKSKKRLNDQLAKKGLITSNDQSNNGITILSSTQAISDLEKNNIRQYQARGAGRLVTPSNEGSKTLKKARKEGRLAEELLDRRSKLKSDRYAK